MNDNRKRPPSLVTVTNFDPDGSPSPKSITRFGSDVLTAVEGKQYALYRISNDLYIKPDLRVTKESLFTALNGIGIQFNMLRNVRSRQIRAATINDLYYWLLENVKQYNGISRIPQLPQDNSLWQLATLPPRSKESQGRLDDFVQFFHPATELDRALLRALIRTPFWGENYGKRPLFAVVTADGYRPQNAGKSTLVEKIGRVLGPDQLNEVQLQDRREGARAQILSFPDSPLVLIDNLTNTKKDQDELEDLTRICTAPEIFGNRKYFGQERKPNRYTIVITTNEPTFSTDNSDRLFVIKINQCDKSPRWSADVDNFIKKYRNELISEIINELRQAGNGPQLLKSSRFPAWDYSVLAVGLDAHLANAVIERQASEQGAYDGQAQQIGAFKELCRDRRFARPSDDGLPAGDELLKLEEKDVVALWRAATGERRKSDSQISQMLGREVRTGQLPWIERRKKPRRVWRVNVAMLDGGFELVSDEGEG